MGNNCEKDMADGGYDANFDPPLADDDTCCICLLAYREPMLLACGHTYCRTCLNKCNERDEFLCPLDRRLINPDQVRLAQGLQFRVLALNVRCGNIKNGCQWKGCLRLLQQHERTCEYYYIKCPQCSKQILQIEQNNHVTQKCDYLFLSCGLCQETYLLKDEQTHIEGCKYWLISCTNGCKEVFRRVEMEDHLNICPLVGCTASASSSKMEDHLNICPLVGCTASASSSKGGTNQSEVDSTEIQNQLKSALDKIYHLEVELTISKQKNENLQKELDVQKNLLQIHIKESFKRGNELTARLEKLENEGNRSIRTEQSTNSIVGSIADWIFQSDDVENIPESSRTPTAVASVASVASDAGSSQSPTYELNDSLSNFQIRDAGSRQLATNELNDGFSNFQIKSDLGTFTWKIKNYQQKLEVGKREDKCIYSEPFFAKCGYKMRLEVWLDGFGIAKGTGVSLYFILMPGPHDTKLKWPFPHPITLSVLNQSDETKHRERTYDPFQVHGVANELHFGRPVYVENKGYGCGTLITHAHIVNNGFLKDNAVYFKCKIHA